MIGSRFASGGSFKSSAARRGVQRFIAWVVSAYARTKLTDATSGFRASGPKALAVFAEHYPVEWLGDTVEEIATEKVGIIKPKPVGAGRYILIGIGVVAAAAVAYAAWQTLRADDDLWVEDEPEEPTAG